MGGSLEEKCHYYQGCISSSKELIRMGQGISYQDKNGQVKLRLKNSSVLSQIIPFHE